MRAELEAERALRRGLEDQNERLRHFIRQLQRMQFSRRSEKRRPLLAPSIALAGTPTPFS